MKTLTDIVAGGEPPYIYKEMGQGDNSIAIITGPRNCPKCIIPGDEYFDLGLYDIGWARKAAAPSGAATYYVRIEPIYGNMSDTVGNPLRGPMNEESALGTSFTFDPFPRTHACTGYKVYAGTISGTLYLQGELTGRDNTSFTVGTTWTPYNPGPQGLADPLLIGPPQFASLAEVYQDEGGINARLILCGGKRYSRGYAQIIAPPSPPTLICGSITPQIIAGSVFDAMTDGSFRMRINGIYWDFVGINTSAATSPDAVAQVVQTAIRASQSGYLAGGAFSATEQTSLLETLQAISDGKLDISFNHVLVPVGSIDFANYDAPGDPIDTLAEAADCIETALQRAGCPALVHWDTTRGAFFLQVDSGYSIPELLANTGFVDTSEWDIEATDWTINTGTNQADFSSGTGDAIRNGNFAASQFWDFSAADWTYDGVGLEADFNSANLNKCADPHCQNIGSWNTPAGSGKWRIVGGTRLQFSGATDSNDWAHCDCTGILGVDVQVLLNVTACTGLFKIYVGTDGSTPTGYTSPDLDISEPGFYKVNIKASAAGQYIGIRPYGGTLIEVDEIGASVGNDSTTQQLTQIVGPLQEFDSWTLSIAHANMAAGDHFRVVLKGSEEDIYGEIHPDTAASPITEIFNVPAGLGIDTIAIENWSIGNASPNYSVDNIGLTMTAGADDETAISQVVGYLGGKTVTFSLDLHNLDNTEGLKVRIVDADGNVGVESAVLQRAGGDPNPMALKSFGPTDLVVPNDGNHYNRIEFRNENVLGGSTYEMDNVTVKVKAAQAFPPSYMEDPGSAIGTPISETLRMSVDTAEYLANVNKGATTETVQWVDGVYVIKGASDGPQYDLSYLDTVLYSVGTDISGEGYLDGLKVDDRAVYYGGRAANTLLKGDGVVWGKWAEGMLFRAENDAKGVLVTEFIDEETLVVDAGYTGEALEGKRAYSLRPFNAQYYASELGNPFEFKVANIGQLPTSDSDELTFCRKLGTNIVFGMRHHIWMLDGVNLGAPRLVSDVYGAPNPNCVIAFHSGLAILTGEDFAILTEGAVRSMDPENRVKHLLARMEDHGEKAHGRLVETDRGPLLKWWIALDGATSCNAVIVYDPRTGNYWTESSYPMAKCSGVIRDQNDQPVLYTASPGDPFYEDYVPAVNATDWRFPARLFKHSHDYKNDGAPSGMTAEGLVSTVSGGSSYGYIMATLTANGNVSDWQAVVNGSFGIEYMDTVYQCGPIDFSGASDMDDVATLIETAINASELPTASGSNVSVVWLAVDSEFQISWSDIYLHERMGPLHPYFYDVNSIDISLSSWMNGRSTVDEDMSYYVSAIVLTKFDGTTITDPSTQLEVQGLYMMFCDANYQNWQYHQIVGWNTTFHRVHIPPETSFAIAAGWHWFLGCINPRWKKWLDFGSPQHEQRLYAVSVTVDPNEGADHNTLAVHGYLDLRETIRTTKLIDLGGTSDTVHRINPGDKPSPQHCVELMRPSSSHDFQLEDIIITHRPIV